MKRTYIGNRLHFSGRSFTDSTRVKYVYSWPYATEKGLLIRAENDSILLIKDARDSVRRLHLDSIQFLKSNIASLKVGMWFTLGVGTIINIAAVVWADNAFSQSVSFWNDMAIVFGYATFASVGLYIGLLGPAYFYQYGKKTARDELEVFRVPLSLVHSRRKVNKYIRKEVIRRIKFERRTKRVLRRRKRDGYKWNDGQNP